MKRIQLSLSVLGFLLIEQSAILASDQVPFNQSEPSVVNKHPARLAIPKPAAQDLAEFTPNVPEKLKVHFNGVNPLEKTLQAEYKNHQQQIQESCYELKFLQKNQKSNNTKEAQQEIFNELLGPQALFSTERFPLSEALEGRVPVGLTLDQYRGLKQEWSYEFLMRIMKIVPAYPIKYPQS
jgi:hypothetical protein